MVSYYVKVNLVMLCEAGDVPDDYALLASPAAMKKWVKLVDLPGYSMKVCFVVVVDVLVEACCV